MEKMKTNAAAAEPMNESRSAVGTGDANPAGASGNGSDNTLKKNMGLAAAMAAVVGSVIGSGIFFKPQAMYTMSGGAPGLPIIAWIVTGVVCILAAMTFAEIAILMPETGGIPVYLERIFGEKVGYLAGWMQTVLFYPAMTAALGVACAQQTSLLLTGGKYLVPIAVTVIIIIVILNCIGSAIGSAVQIISTVGKLIPIFLIMLFGCIKGSNTAPILSPALGDGLNPVIVMGQLMIAVLFAFEGWTNVGPIAGEMKNPGRDLPLAIIGGVSLITAVYLIINIAYLRVLPADELMNLAAPASAVAEKIFGSAGAVFISIGIMVSTFGTCNAFIMGGSRVAFRMAEEGKFPASGLLSRINSRRTPANAIILEGTIGAIFAISGQFNLLTDLAVFSSWTFYTLTFAAVMKYRRMTPDLERSYKVPGYPVVPVIAIASGIFVLFNQLFMAGSSARLLALFSIGITLLGLPVYSLVQRGSVNRKK